MVGGVSKFVLTGTHIHVFSHTHTQLISQNGKEIEITHTHSPNGGRDLEKKVKDLTPLGRIFRRCRQSCKSPTNYGTIRMTLIELGKA